MKNEKTIGIIAFIVIFLVATFISYIFFHKAKPTQDITQTATDITNPLGTSNVGSTTSPLNSTFELFYVALNDGGKMGKKIGCDDSIVGVLNVVSYTQSPLRVALEMLLKDKRQKINADIELNNTISQSTLSLSELSLLNGDARIKLTGEYKSGGVCDEPRFENQIRETALQFPSVKSVHIFLNGKPLSEALSQK